jgi:hypothetical protein
MGNVVPALRQTVSLLADVPLLVPAIAAVFVASSILSTILQIVPLIGFLLVLAYAVVGRAAVSAVVLSLVSGAARRGSLGVEGGVDAVVDDTLPLAGAYAVVAGAGLVVAIGGATVLAVAAGLAPAPAGTGVAVDGGVGAVGALAVVAVVVVALVAVVAGVVIQFLDVAVVLGGASALGSFRTAWTAVRRAPLSVAGYTVVRAAIVAVPLAAVVGGGLALVVGPGLLAAGAGTGAGDPSELGAALAGSLLAFVGLLAVTFLLVAPLVRAVSTAFHAVFFARLRREFDLPPHDAGGTEAADSTTATPAADADAGTGTGTDPGPARLETVRPPAD